MAVALKLKSSRARLVLALASLLICSGLVVLVAHAESQSSQCLLIETSAVTELLDPQAFSVRTVNYPVITARDGTPVIDYKYSPDGTHLAIIQGTAIADLTVETLAKPYPVSTFSDTFLVMDSVPPVTMAWSPDSHWIAVEGYTKNTHYLTVMDAI